ncbi:MBL fold metallo-hydrolase [Brevibacillus ginsengisoli]|uniref:MBL fold metallo-hydrolase n=1 Tax=Brevibacillus ginsengisoli TaxID=363854 RepID=UPI003CE6D4ED
MKLQVIRHATLLLSIKDQNILVDPMLGPKESAPPIINSGNTRRNPLVDLPSNLPIWNEIDALLITHCHRDHLDDTAKEILPKHLPVFCQPTDVATLRDAGFTDVIPIQDTFKWNNITITRTNGQHGTGEIGKAMGNVSGFVLAANEEPTLYIAGDTIWCDDVREAITSFQPSVTVLNAGAAQFIKGDPITMDAKDVREVCHHVPNSKVVAVHMEAINHCLLTRDELRSELERSDLINRVSIPLDGEVLYF